MFRAAGLSRSDCPKHVQEGGWIAALKLRNVEWNAMRSVHAERPCGRRCMDEVRKRKGCSQLATLRNFRAVPLLLRFHQRTRCQKSLPDAAGAPTPLNQAGCESFCKAFSAPVNLSFEALSVAEDSGLGRASANSLSTSFNSGFDFVRGSSAFSDAARQDAAAPRKNMVPRLPSCTRASFRSLKFRVRNASALRSPIVALTSLDR